MSLPISEKELSELRILLAEAAEIDRKQKELEARNEECRAKILDIMGKYVPDDADSGNEVIPGVQIKVDHKTDFDLNAALEWSTAPENIRGAAGFLQVRSTMVATIVELVLANGFQPSLVFDVNKTGYAAGLRSNSHVGMPHKSMTKRKTLSLKIAALKHSAELTELFTIVEPTEATA